MEHDCLRLHAFFHKDFPLKEGTLRIPLPFSRNWHENHSHNLGKALGKGLGLLCAPFTLSIPFTSLSLSHFSLSLFLSYLSLPLYISPSTFFLSLSFSLSFSLAYLMDVFVLVCLCFLQAIKVAVNLDHIGMSLFNQILE